MNPIIGLVGPSGSGKSTLILKMLELYPERLEITRSLTSRPERGGEDGLFYDFVSADEIRRRQALGLLTHFAEYAGNLYATDRQELEAILSERCAIAALVESGVRSLRQAGYEVKVVRIVPVGNGPTEDLQRREADAARAKTGLGADLEIANSFAPGGLESSVMALSEFIRSL